MKLSLIDRIDDQIRRLRLKIDVLRNKRAELLSAAASMTSVHPLIDSVIADRCKLPQNYGDLSLHQRKIIGSDKLMSDSLFPFHECELLQRRVNGSDKERLALGKAIAWAAVRGGEIERSQKPVQPEYITMQQLCERWGVCRATINIWRSKGNAAARMKLASHKIGGKVLFSIAHIELFMREASNSSLERGHAARRLYKQTGKWR